MTAFAGATRLRELAHRPGPAHAAQGPAHGPDDRCDLCSCPVPGEHRHLLDVPDGTLLCACGACALLFDQQETGVRRYRLLPRRRLRLDGFRIDDHLWASLGIPVGLAFFVREAATGETAVAYPSPLGAPRATVAPAVWAELAGGHPAVAGLAGDVEALLVHRGDVHRGEGRAGPGEHWIVPLDDCYRLVGVVRTHWKGLTGGPEARSEIERFFAELAPSAPVRGDG
ncbi:DUF5947 family protein [Streptomyces sp. NPDC049577]|uniref:DUF5947 family protein n=1 Tax=Streptomyces sp. NPDC049577 TaxID=3155153 RepID=UPI003416603E